MAEEIGAIGLENDRRPQNKVLKIIILYATLLHVICYMKFYMLVI